MSSDYIIFGAPCLGEAEIDEVVDSLRSGWIGTGPKVARFEDMLADYTRAKHVVAVNSCTAALHLSLIVSGIGPGDEVITTPFTFAATINAIIHTGATPVLVDCRKDTQLIDADALAGAITPHTRAILPVHMAGRVCDMDKIAALADAHGLTIIEDAAHALEAEWCGRKIGSISRLTCFSFYVTKNATTAEGGAITTDDADLADQLKIYALHGMTRDAWRRYSDSGYRHYDIVCAGFKYNMTDLQAAIGIHQLGRVPTGLCHREKIWQTYDAAFAGLPIELPAPADVNTVHARHLYTVLVDREKAGLSRDAFMAALHERGVGTGVHYRAAHLQTYYQQRFGWRAEQFPAASWLSERTVSLPLSACLSHTDVERVIEAVHSALATA
jgi:dTDP-4-amino-4,6-dideoxygalactose transaminase